MSLLATSLILSWVLFWFAIVGICAPLAALGRAAGRRTVMPDIGPALVCSWLTLAIGVWLAGAVHGFNWVTALVISAVCPVALWLSRHRGGQAAAFRQVVRSVIVRAVTLRLVRAPRFNIRECAAPIIGIALLSCSPLLLGGGLDVRVPVPADFDVLQRARQILGGAAVWDPLASLAAVLTRVSAASPLHVANAIRLALVALTGMAAGLLVAEVRRRRSTIGVVAVALTFVLLAPWAPAATWTILLAALIGATSFFLWIRDRQSRDGWYAVAAVALAAGQLLPFAGNLDVLARVSRTAQYLEYPAAARAALQLDRASSDVEWVLVGFPEQQLEIANGRFYDLARFVSRFRDRTGHPGFRFDLGAERIYVMVEKRPFDAGTSVSGGQFVDAQPVSYRVPRERFRMSQLAQEICDEYRRTHAGAAIIFDDEALRVYQIDR
jgi:hypothetical protein